MEKRKAVTVRVTGRVQGVAYRAWTRDQAEAFGLSGWVRNEADGSVAALLAGPEAAVATMIGRLREGPPAAAVADVAIEDHAAAEPEADGSVISRSR